MTATEPKMWDELLEVDGTPRPNAAYIVERIRSLGIDELRKRQHQADIEILTSGVTFTVYADSKNIDRAWPFDVVPRVIAASEWRSIESGLKQRLKAINLFINDLYNEQAIIADGVFPADMLTDSVNFRPECRGAHPTHGVWAHISGSDLVRDGDGTMYVLEDNLRVPSGVSYMLENRQVSKHTMADLFETHSVLPVDAYPTELLRLLRSLAPDIAEPTVVVLTPGVFNSAYFEHSFLAQRMGVDLVEGRDLFVDSDDWVYERTIAGPKRVDVIYRRVDDLFLDPEAFRPDSTLGVPGLMRAWTAGKVAIANAPGAGVADDKAVYAWVPDIIRYYLNEEPQIPNVPTLRCSVPEERKQVIDNMREFVVKPANESGGYGLLIGIVRPTKRFEPAKNPSRPTHATGSLSQSLASPLLRTLCEGGLQPRHLDLRPFILTGATSYVTAGGLTRVALREGSLVVNSSQGGGSKDTWIVEDERDPASPGHQSSPGDQPQLGATNASI